MRRGAFDELSGHVGAVEISGPGILSAVEHDVGFGLRVVIGKIRIERDAKRAIDVVHLAIDKQVGLFSPENHILIIAGVDVHLGRNQAALLEFQYRARDRLPLRERGPQGIQFGRGVGRRVGVGGQKITNRFRVRIDDVRVHGGIGRVQMPAQRIAVAVQLDYKCLRIESPRNEDRQAQNPGH